MTNPSIAIGSHLTVKDGRYKGRQVEVLEVKDNSVRCKFINLNADETKMQSSGSDFEPTWLGLDSLDVPSTGSQIGQTERGQTERA